MSARPRDALRGLLLLAADEVAEGEDVASKLRSAPNDEVVLTVVEHEITRRYEALARLSMGGVPAPPIVPPGAETLGVRDTLAAGRAWISEFLDGARSLVDRTSRIASTRAASLLALKAKRDSLTLTAGIFLGDIFEYLRRGQGGPGGLGTIADRVEKKLCEASRLARARSEPLIVVAHSFGGIITYDLLTSPFTAAGTRVQGFQDRPVGDRRIAGGDFAEMRAYVGSPGDIPTDRTPTLGKPPRIGSWLNFYDAADVFSYLAEPVFGKEAVTDIEVSADANLKNAHGDLFRRTVVLPPHRPRVKLSSEWPRLLPPWDKHPSLKPLQPNVAGQAMPELEKARLESDLREAIPVHLRDQAGVLAQFLTELRAGQMAGAIPANGRQTNGG